MSVWINLLLLLAGAALLAKASDFVVKQAVAFAQRMRISPFVIGAGLLAVGTNFPELAVAAFSHFAGDSSLAMSVVIGSNMANLGVLLAVAALFIPVHINREVLNRDVRAYFWVSVALLLMALDSRIDRLEGLVFLFALLFYFWHLFRHKPQKLEAAEEKIELESLFKLDLHSGLFHLLSILAGIAALLFFAHITSTSAHALATELGIASGLIGLTVLSLATNLPEAALMFSALKSRQATLMVGNLVGGNILRILFILGVLAAGRTISLTPAEVWVYVPFQLVMAIVLTLAVYLQHEIRKPTAIALLVIYGFFLGRALTLT